MTTTTTTYHPRRTLPLRVELMRQIRRRRTLVAYLLMIALPLIVVAAVKFGPSSEGDGGSGGADSGGFGGGGLNLIGLATSGAWNFAIVMILFGSGFLLTVTVALFHGDTVASEASWSTLRYLLAAPVPRRRLLRVKLLVAGLLSLGALATLVIASWLIGALAFGTGPLVSPLTGSLDGSAAALRVLIIAGYVAVSLMFAAGIAFYMSVRTDVPLGAVGTAVMIAIVIQILDAITALGSLREWLPGHYSQAWLDALAAEISWGGMARGAAYSLVWFTLLVGLAFLHFDRKDVLS